MSKIFPYISFPGNAHEVFTYYHTVFGGELELLTYGELLDQGVEIPFEVQREAVAHGVLVGTFNLTGGDDGEKSGPITSGDFSFVIEVDSTDEGTEIIDQLVNDGGSVKMPFEPAPWGGHFGQVEDKFGVMWQVSTSS